MNIESIKISDYTYVLPEDRIAQFPLEKRDEAKLQVYNKGEIVHRQFKHMGEYLSPDSLLVFNNTRVIRARIFFTRKTGSKIEVFVLEPANTTPIHLALSATDATIWKCMIGNKRKWKKGEVLSAEIPAIHSILTAELIDPEQQLVRFSWDNSAFNFGQILEHLGKVPLPPYIKRATVDSDSEKYQTIYSKEEGAVAAPTAGLHFTQAVFEDLKKRGVETANVTLHVGAGTFLPVKEERVIDHPMHSEEVSFTLEIIEQLIAKAGNIIAVGTTVARVLESIHWVGVLLVNGKLSGPPDASFDFFVPKLIPYDASMKAASPLEALHAIKSFMEANKISAMIGRTEIIIVPGYSFKMCKGLITNYHMPDSTLILLIAALIGEDWRRVYQEALDNGYRFFSYGDSSLLIP